MPRPSDPERAARHPSTHALVRGRGFVEFGPDEALQEGCHPRTRCAPPHGAGDGSRHYLTPPTGGVPGLVFAWSARDSTWLPQAQDLHRSKRCGFTADYLSSHGWRYAGPAE